MKNYDRMLEAARLRFLSYDSEALGKRPGVEESAAHLRTRFFAQPAAVEKATGRLMIAGCPADFGQTLSVYDWLCDRREDARLSGEFCPVGSLPGVYVGGKGLTMDMPGLAADIENEPEAFRHAMEIMEAERLPLGDMGYRLQIFPDLPMCLKFYFADEDFPPSLTLLWDQSTLHFVRYETVYYIAGCLRKRLLALMKR